MDALNAVLPAVWSHNNPIDIIGDAPPDRYAKALEIAAADPETDGLLVILTPQAMTDPTATARALVKHARIEGKPVLASWMGGADVEEGARILREAGIPTFAYPDTACVLFNHLWRYDDQPAVAVRDAAPARSRPSAASSARRSTGSSRRVRPRAGRCSPSTSPRRSSRPTASRSPTPSSPTTEDEAVAAADAIGYPVVAKLLSRTITHKTDVGGVVLNLRTADAVREAFAKIRDAVAEKAGAEHFEGVTDPADDQLVRLRADRGLLARPAVRAGPAVRDGRPAGRGVQGPRARPAAAQHDARPAAHRARRTIAHALKGVRGRKPIDKDVLAALLVRFSELVAEQPRIAEIDINPLLASPERVIALDARVVLHPASIADADLPRLAIRPYPHEYEREAVTEDGVAAARPARSAPRTSRPSAAFHAGALGRDGPRPLRHGPPARGADRARAADPDLLRRLRPPVRARRRGAAAARPTPEFAGIARVSRIHALATTGGSR